MRITLEMVDEIINRTGVSYKEAKEALELHEGDLLKAIVHLEDKKNGTGEFECKSEKHMSGQEIVDKLKALANEGFINQIIVEKNGKVVVDIPVMAGAIGAVMFTIPTVAAIIAAVATGCQIKIVKKDGEILNINEMTNDKFDELKSKFNTAMNSGEMKNKESEKTQGSTEKTEDEAVDDSIFEKDEEKY